MKNLIKNRRGLAVEMAVIVMLIFVAMSIVLMSISGMQVGHKKSDLSDFDRKTELYEIADYIKKNHSEFSKNTEYTEQKSLNEKNYDIEMTSTIIEGEGANEGNVENREYKYTIYILETDENSNETKKIALIITIDNNGTISSWEE